jgi:F-type H+-transporting ATPase subunit alpha
MLPNERLLSTLSERIAQYQFPLQPVSMGTVSDVGDGIVIISGLADAMIGELVEFVTSREDQPTKGMVLNLTVDAVGAIALGDMSDIHVGGEVRSLGRVVSVPVGEALLGRVVDPLGHPLDDSGGVDDEGVARSSSHRPAESPAPGIIQRAPVNVPLLTGIKAIDALVPIGRGQRQLIVGDRQTGKSTLAIDAILAQSLEDVICVYVAIGQKLSSIAQTVALLSSHGAMEHTIVVSADASKPAALQYLAPYAGCAMAEEFMDQGRDVLVVYDDLTKHAWAYRQISLLLKRPPGREAFPGDIFYLHARLLERAGRLSPEYGGGSITALPIIETQMGDLAAYVPTNVISITDGQIYLEQELFHAGVRPAINAGLSVSRVGGAAQCPAMKSVAGELRLAMAQYRELLSFAQFGTELDPATQRTLDRGARILEILKQGQHQPLALPDQIAIFFAASQGYLDDQPVADTRRLEQRFVQFLNQRHQGLRNAIAIQRTLSPELSQQLSDTIAEFKEAYCPLPSSQSSGSRQG